MSKSLADALEGSAWSVSKVVFDLNDMLDDEGRPISERRADATVRAGVEMEMRECPYSGIRHGRQMNMSALAQISNHYNPVMAEIAAFRSQVGPGEAGWPDILAVVMDQLARPAIHLLQQRDSRGPVPAQAAVGHKLAAGLFGVMRTLHERLTLGAELPVTADVFMQLVEETGALVGASEACAGSPQMIRKTTVILVEGGAANEVVLDQARQDIARCLAQQVQLGIFWQLYDQCHVWELLRGDTRQQLRPSNDFLARKQEQAATAMSFAVPGRPEAARLPASLDAEARSRLSDGLRDAADPLLLEEDIQTAIQLLGEAGSAIPYQGDAGPFARRVACYLNAHRQFAVELGRLEYRLRGLLGFPAEAPVHLGAAVFPQAQALPWYEMVLGRRLGEAGHLTGSCSGIRTRSSVAP
jgi:hypothetical protein